MVLGKIISLLRFIIKYVLINMRISYHRLTNILRKRRSQISVIDS